MQSKSDIRYIPQQHKLIHNLTRALYIELQSSHFKIHVMSLLEEWLATEPNDSVTPTQKPNTVHDYEPLPTRPYPYNLFPYD